MGLAAAAPTVAVAITSGALVAWGSPKLRRSGKGLTPSQWGVALFFGAVAAVVVRALEVLVLGLVVDPKQGDAKGFFTAVEALGLVGPLSVLGQVAAAWGALSLGKRDDTDPPIAAAIAAIGFTLGRVSVLLTLGLLHSGVRAAALGIDEIAIATLWGYGLALSAADGRLGGTPFGRYAVSAMVLRGMMDLAVRERTALGLAIALGVGGVLGIVTTIGAYRLTRDPHGPPSERSLGRVGRATLTELARQEFRRGRIRPLWILVGTLANVGGIALGLATAVLVGRSAHVDFGEIDRQGPAREYAGLLLVLGVVSSFPITAAIVALASGGRDEEGHAHVIEAGVSAMLALGALLFVLGVVAPIAVAIALACAPVAFLLAAIGAYIAAGRKV